MKAHSSPMLLPYAWSLLLLCGASRATQPLAAVKVLAGQASATPSASTHVTTRPLAASDFSRLAAHLDHSLVPNVVGPITPDSHQSFLVKGQGFPEFSVVPVRYDSTNPDTPQSTSRCGVYIIPAAGRSSFVRTLGYGSREAEICSGLLGVSFLAVSGKPPQIILLYNGGSFNSPGKDPVILAWNATTIAYESDDEVVTHLGSATTVPAFKAKLKSLQP